MNLIIVIPTLNEKENLNILLPKLFNLNISHDVLIVDDGSTDGTIEFIRNNAHFMKDLFILERRNKKKGLGPSYIDGFKWAIEKQYDLILEMDGDYSHRPKYIIPMLKKLQDFNLDVVIGSRYVNGISVINWPLSRLIISYFANYYVRLILAVPIKDMTAGFVLYKRKVLESINLDKIMSNGYGFQIELKYKLWNKGFKIGECPIIFYERENGKSKLSRKIVIESFLKVIYFRILKLFNKL